MVPYKLKSRKTDFTVEDPSISGLFTLFISEMWATLPDKFINRILVSPNLVELSYGFTFSQIFMRCLVPNLLF